jgi:GTPase SAR1 family protein
LRNLKNLFLIFKLNIWDFSGKLSEPKVRSEFYAELHAVVYMFDLSNILTFNSLESWIREAKRNGGEKLIPVLLGGKSDLKKEVTSGMIEDFLNKYKFNYYEVNVKDMSIVKKFFHEFSNNAYELKPKERTR